MIKFILAVIKDRSFVICAVLLFVASLSIKGMVGSLQLHLQKSPVPLVKSFDQFDVWKMWPYKMVVKRTLPDEMVEELGTKEYLQMVFEDTRITDAHARGKYINLFVTYYSKVDQVPHVPDVCYVGGGNDLLSATNTTIKVPGVGLKDDELPVRELIFQNPNDVVPVLKPVIYFFSVNGRFDNGREGVRLSLADPRVKYAYFSKVELSFEEEPMPDKEEALKIASGFLSKALPILIKEHWQDWDSFIAKEKSRKEASGEK
jgi:hypothetical protein